ncbi:dihydroorotate dehydrogenase electron transfer subunit [Xenorhabdus sp. PB30.3]|uniref:dihydroorotate dehydrogenase electron transfer subunit n=1 Tax=Xenorhabdus sp. PB30.3 TaxID=2788941 RepID=UPI001E63AA0C|nr:dihydroorotate dehydrogenase electron transfer subunit [Xenorhabdus sp. PB30.3]MCC8378169.1 dihydroorotate dehydrogenase electron transfer subunit [Xenorhabdus sp. PB30.3]
MSDIVCFERNAEQVASYRCLVSEHHWVNKRYKYLRLSANADLNGSTHPGQFYMLKCPDVGELHPFLLRPMSVYGTGPEPGTIEFLYNVSGVGTKALADLSSGNEMEIVGPLGNTFTLRAGFHRVMMVARGVGLATMAPLIQKAACVGIELTVVMSARTPEDLMRDAFLRGVDADVYCLYDNDGTSAVSSLDKLLREILSKNHHDMVYTCGSHRILRLLQSVLTDFSETEGEVALEQRMACGMGVCLSCVRPILQNGQIDFLRVCREGPVFPIRSVIGEVEFA